MNRIFAIGDIHGCLRTLKKMILETLKIQRSDLIYFMGDYIDRGNDPKGVIDFIMQMRSDGYQVQTLRGNHEQMMLDSLSGKFYYKEWLKNGGKDTMRSFGIASLIELPNIYRTFLEETQFYIESGEYILVHAGLNFEIKDPFEDEEAMLWIRDFDPFQPILKDRILIHGHTPKPLSYILNQQGNCINIDGGCVYSNMEQLAKLVAYDLLKKNFIVVDNCE